MVTGVLFCYIELAMRQFARIVSSPRWSAVWMAVIVGSLCFSVGEGLRLTPFLVTASPQVEETNGLTAALAKYGPLDVPSLVQKRSKRQATDFACQTPVASSESASFLRHYAADESVHLRSTRSVSRSAGRAPPFAS